MPYYCTVPRCTSMAGKAKNVSFHQFPRDERLAKLWNEVLKRGKPYTKYSKVCSLHFKPEDYTIATGQKNKGQWRTLRKDAVPSQNLPSETPADEWQRRNTSQWPPSLNMDTGMHHQMAQAIYVQTMLAMQAAGIGDSTISSLNTDQPSPSMNESHDEDSDSNIQTNEHTKELNIINLPEKVTFKCTECSKCFKDPDVLLLHKRTHTKPNLLPSNTEMLKANPILANLLKNDSENVNKNVASIENQIMSALTENMANYLKNLSTIMTAGNTEYSIDNDTAGRKDENSISEKSAANDFNVKSIHKNNYKENITCVEDLTIEKTENKSSSIFRDIDKGFHETRDKIESQTKDIDNRFQSTIDYVENCDN